MIPHGSNDLCHTAGRIDGKEGATVVRAQVPKRQTAAFLQIPVPQEGSHRSHQDGDPTPPGDDDAVIGVDRALGQDAALVLGQGYTNVRVGFLFEAPFPDDFDRLFDLRPSRSVQHHEVDGGGAAPKWGAKIDPTSGPGQDRIGDAPPRQHVGQARGRRRHVCRLHVGIARAVLRFAGRRRRIHGETAVTEVMVWTLVVLFDVHRRSRSRIGEAL